MSLPDRSLRRRSRTLAAAFLVLVGLVSAAPGWSAPERSTAAAEVALTHGILAFNEGDLEQAAKLFEEAVQWDDRNGTARHWLGVTYLKLGRAAEAVAQLEKIKQPPEAGRGRVEADLKMARELAQRGGDIREEVAVIEAPGAEPLSNIPGLRPWSALISVEAGGDSNPGLLPEQTLGIPVVSAGPAEATADQALRLDLQIDLNPMKPRGNWSLGASFAGSQAVYQDLDDLDLSLVRATVSAARGTDPRGYLVGPLGPVKTPSLPGRMSLVLQGSGTYVLLGGEAYLRMAEAAASLLFRQATRLDLAARERSLERDGRGALTRSGAEVSMGASQYFTLGRGERNLRAGVLAGLRGGGKAFESSFGETFAEVSLPLASPWTLFLQGTYREERFENPESRLGSLSGPNRRDESWWLTASLVWKTSEHLRWTARASSLRNDSNIEFPVGLPLFDHRRTVLALGTIWSL